MLEDIRSLHLALGIFTLSLIYLKLQSENPIHIYLNQNQAWTQFSFVLAVVIYYGLIKLRGP